MEQKNQSLSSFIEVLDLLLSEAKQQAGKSEMSGAPLQSSKIESRDRLGIQLPKQAEDALSVAVAYIETLSLIPKLYALKELSAIFKLLKPKVKSSDIQRYYALRFMLLAYFHIKKINIAVRRELEAQLGEYIEQLAGMLTHEATEYIIDLMDYEAEYESERMEIHQVYFYEIKSVFDELLNLDVDVEDLIPGISDLVAEFNELLDAFEQGCKELSAYHKQFTEAEKSLDNPAYERFMAHSRVTEEQAKKLDNKIKGIENLLVESKRPEVEGFVDKIGGKHAKRNNCLIKLERGRQIKQLKRGGQLPLSDEMDYVADLVSNKTLSTSLKNMRKILQGKGTSAIDSQLAQIVIKLEEEISEQSLSKNDVISLKELKDRVNTEYPGVREELESRQSEQTQEQPHVKVIVTKLKTLIEGLDEIMNNKGEAQQVTESLNNVLQDLGSTGDIKQKLEQLILDVTENGVISSPEDSDSFEGALSDIIDLLPSSPSISSLRI